MVLPPDEKAKKPKPRTEVGVCPLTTREIASGVLKFSEAINDIEFYAYQKAISFRIIESLLLGDGDVLTALLSRQSGKSECLASTALGLCILLPVLANQFPQDERLTSFRKGVFIGIFAPKLELSGPIYEKVRDRAETERTRGILADPGLRHVQVVQSRGDSLAFSHGSVVKAMTASETSLVEGKTFHLILIDEAQKVSRSKVSKEIAPMLAATNGSMMKIGTAWMSRGGFHNDIQYNMALEERTGKRNHYQYDYEVVIAEKRATYERQAKEFKAKKRATAPDRFHLNYERWITKEIERLGGIDSEEFKMNFRLMWQDNRQIAIKESDLMSCALEGMEMNVPKKWGTQMASLDVAKTGDSSVLTIMEIDLSAPILDRQGEVQAANNNTRTSDDVPNLYYNKYILGWCELQGAFEGNQYVLIQEFLNHFNVGFMYVDSTGMGDPVCERLQVLLPHITVEPFRYTSPSKSDLYKYYLQELKAGRISFPSGPSTIDVREYKNFIHQHLGLSREWNGSYLVVQASDNDDHDDYPDSAAMACLATRRVNEILPTVEVEQETFNGGRNASNRDPYSQAAGGSRSNRYLRRRR